jgi:hypothetical protein
MIHVNSYGIIANNRSPEIRFYETSATEVYFNAGRSFRRARPRTFSSIGVPTNPNRFRS